MPIKRGSVGICVPGSRFLEKSGPGRDFQSQRDGKVMFMLTKRAGSHMRANTRARA